VLSRTLEVGILEVLSHKVIAAWGAGQRKLPFDGWHRAAFLWPKFVRLELGVIARRGCGEGGTGMVKRGRV